MKLNPLILLICSCLLSFLSNASPDSDSSKVNSIIKEIKSLEYSYVKRAEFFSEFDHFYLEGYSPQLFPYIKRDYDNLDQYDSLSLELKFEIQFLMKNVFFIFGEHEHAIKIAYDMLDLAQEINDSVYYYYSYSSISNLELELGNQKSAIEFLLLANKYAAVSKAALAESYVDLAYIYLGEEGSDEKVVYDYAMKGIKLGLEAGDDLVVNYGYSVLMDYHYWIDDLDSALYYYNVVDSLHSLNHELQVSRTYVNITIKAAEIYREKKDYEKSSQLFQEAFRLAKQSNDRQNLVYIYNQWAKLEELRGDYPRSLELFKNHALLQDSLFKESSLMQVNTLKTIYQIQKKDLEIEASKNKEKYAKKQTYYIVIIGIIFLSGLIILIFFLRTKLKASRLREKLIKERGKNNQYEIEKLEREVQLKNKELADLFLHQFEKATLLNDVIESVDVSSAKLKQALHNQQDKKKDWDNFKAHFDKVHEGFFDKLKALSPDLTAKDIRFCAYIRMNLSSKEIAIMLGISHRTVQGIKGRVRKKIELDSSEDIVKFLMDL